MPRSPDTHFSRFRQVLLPALAVGAMALFAGACGGSDSVYDGSPPPDYSGLDGSSPPLDTLYSQANDLIPGGTEAFDRQMAELRGLSWEGSIAVIWAAP